MRKALLMVAVVVVLELGIAVVCQAQPALEALEKKVRQDAGLHAAPAAQPAASPVPAAPATLPPGAGQATARPAGREPGYAGIMVDDREDRGRGVRILKVNAGGPGEKAGLQAQDLITGLGGVRVRQLSDMIMILEQVPPGGTLEFEVVRGSETRKLDVKFGRRAAADGTGARPSGDQAQPAPATAPPAGAKEDEPSRVEAMERRIEQLEQRIRALERALGFPEAK